VNIKTIAGQKSILEVWWFREHIYPWKEEHMDHFQKFSSFFKDFFLQAFGYSLARFCLPVWQTELCNPFAWNKNCIKLKLNLVCHLDFWVIPF